MSGIELEGEEVEVGDIVQVVMGDGRSEVFQSFFQLSQL